MELTDTIRARRMVRSFVPDAVGRDLVDGLCDLARRAPSAGNSQAVDLLVLEGPEQVDAYWDVTLPEERRRTFRWQGLLIAPVLILVAVSPDGYVERYAEDDKAETGLGVGTDSWPVPYWWVDAGAAIENLLLGVVDVGLGACLFGAFGHERAVAERFGVPSDRRLVATIAVGHPDTSTAVRGRSAGRPRRTLDEVIHRGTW